jgi:hypothetical protein
MNDTMNILKFPSSCINRNELRAGSTARRMPVRSSLNDISEGRSDREASADQKVSRKSIRLSSADYYSLTDRIEYFLFSLMSGAAIVSVLLWILSLHSLEPRKLGPAGTRPLPHAESPLVTQNRG